MNILRRLCNAAGHKSDLIGFTAVACLIIIGITTLVVTIFAIDLVWDAIHPVAALVLFIAALAAVVHYTLKAAGE